MSTKIVTDLECDIPSPKGKPPHEANLTVRYTIQDTSFEMDLCPEHEAKFTKAVAPYVEVSRIVRPVKAPAVAHRSRSASNGHRPARRPAADRKRSADVRAWAKANGIPVNERGRISAIVEAQYAARQPS